MAAEAAEVVKYQREKAATTAVGLLFRKPNANAVSVVFSTIPLCIVYIYIIYVFSSRWDQKLGYFFSSLYSPPQQKTHLTDCVHRPMVMVNICLLYIYYIDEV